MTDRRLTFFSRYASMFLDHASMVFVLMGFMLVFFLPLFLLKKYVFGWWIMSKGVGLTLGFLLMGLFGSVYLNKDCIRGRAPGKRLMLHVIVNYGTNEIASPVRCLIRSVTMMLIAPVEIVVTLFSPNRRIGDYIAGTEVVKLDESIVGERNFKKIGLSIIYGTVACALLVFIQVVVLALFDDPTATEDMNWSF